MNFVAILLVLASAFLHAFWNLLSKKSKNKLVFNWFIVLLAPVIYFPVFLYLIFKNPIPAIGFLFIILSGIFITFYFYFLGKSYQHGHLSLAYPISRSSTIFVPFLAAVIIKEQLSLKGILGIIIIVAGVYMLHLRSFNLKSFLEPLRYVREKATLFALLTALFSAFYSVNDSIGVNYVFPFLFIYLAYFVSSITYLPIVFSKDNHKDIKNEWLLNKNSILISAFIAFLSYMLVLFAFRIDNVSYVVALRQLSIVFGVILGSFVLKEKYGKVRFVVTMLMLVGFFLVATA